MAITRVKTWTAETLTSSDLNAEFDNIINNLDTDNIDDYSVSIAEMRTTANPGESGSESQATNLTGEITRLRFALLETKQAIDSGTTYWYESPTNDTFIASPGSSTDNAIARWNGTGGTAIQDSGITIDDSDNIDTGTGNLDVGGTLNADGATTLNGAVTLGDASGDAITITGTMTVAEELALTTGGTGPYFLPTGDDTSAPAANRLYKANTPKAWAHLDTGSGGSVVVDNDHNISSASYSSAVMTVNIDTNLASADYAIAPCFIQAASDDKFITLQSLAVGSFGLELFDLSGGAIANWASGDDAAVIVMGDQ